MGNRGDSRPSEKKGRGREKGRRGEGSLLTHSPLSCPFSRQPLWGPGGGTQSDKLIPKGLCPARALVLLRGDNELMSHEPGENGKEGRRAGSWR